MVENTDIKLFWDSNIQCDHVIKERQYWKDPWSFVMIRIFKILMAEDQPVSRHNNKYEFLDQVIAMMQKKVLMVTESIIQRLYLEDNDYFFSFFGFSDCG